MACRTCALAQVNRVLSVPHPEIHVEHDKELNYFNEPFLRRLESDQSTLADAESYQDLVRPARGHHHRRMDSARCVRVLAPTRAAGGRSRGEADHDAA